MSFDILLSIWAIALVLALAAIAAIVRPLFLVLTDMCGGRDRARFWTAYASVLTLAAPLLVVSAPGLLNSPDNSGLSSEILQKAVFYILAGIVCAFLIVGRIIWAPVEQMLAETSADRHEARRGGAA
ncbi:hypothetical protein [Rhodomicrobium sp.]|uniref:hypothetical protein n=1 Tax=Rhodomicrobium sp. TaxID=2720632 RepID=UPI0039E41573